MKDNLLTWLGVSLSATIFFLLLLWRVIRSKNGAQRPPGPPGWPMIGNMLELGNMPHRSLYKLGVKYGPVIWLNLGSVNTIVVQSAKAAEEMFKKHDLPFSDRKCPLALTVLGYNEGTMALSNYTPYWRVVRKICATEIVSSKRINETAALRKQSIEKLIVWIEGEGKASRDRGDTGEVEIGHLLFLASFNLLGNLILSRDVVDSQSEQGREFFDAMNMFMYWGAKPNVADIFPFLKWLDPARIMKNMEREMGRCIKIVARFVKERIEERKSGTGAHKVKRDMLEALLGYEGDVKEGIYEISEKKIIIIIMEMFFAGSETTSSTIEWAMTELMRNPEQLTKVKQELDEVIGPRNVEEDDIEKLTYLQAVVKETYRFHPVVPLMLPRNTREDTNYMGYLIPKNTQVIVNAWAIARDPEAWEDPLSFRPERFLGSDLDYKGQHYEYLPFGSGRRICFGLSLGHKIVPLILATLLHNFDWELHSGINPATISMEERYGLAVRKLDPLRIIPKTRILHS